MQKETRDLSQMPMGRYDVYYYSRGVREPGSDRDVSLEYVEGAVRGLKSTEGLVAVCISQSAPALVAGDVPGGDS